MYFKTGCCSIFFRHSRYRGSIKRTLTMIEMRASDEDGREYRVFILSPEEHRDEYEPTRGRFRTRTVYWAFEVVVNPSEEPFIRASQWKEGGKHAHEWPMRWVPDHKVALPNDTDMNWGNWSDDAKEQVIQAAQEDWNYILEKVKRPYLPTFSD